MSFCIFCVCVRGRCKLEALSSVVQMYKVIHIAGVHHNNEDGSSEAPSFDTLVALRLAIALMHARKQFHALVRNRCDIEVNCCAVFVLLKF